MTDTTDIAALRLEIAKACDNWIPEIKIHPKLLEKVLDQLEAERQRADKAESYRNYYPSKCIELEAEISALKAKLANPVVHPTRAAGHSYASVAISARDEQWFTAINEAGFTVKGE